MMQKYIFFLLSSIVLFSTSCTSDDEWVMPERPLSSPLVINAHIAGSAATRVVVNPKKKADEWSYIDFTEDDVMGFFSSGGKFTEGTYGQAPFINQPLVYTGGVGGENFRDPDNTDFSPSHMNGNEIYMYFPYAPSITDANGFTLRTNKGTGGETLDTLRCVDFLSTNHLDILSEGVSSSAALYGEFYHTFAELIIMRGEGFDNPPASLGTDRWKIRAVLNTPVTGIRTALAEDGESWKCTPELVWDSLNVERLDASTWEAWHGGNYSKTQQDTIGQSAWYVIVPTLGCKAAQGAQRDGLRTVVQYIELYDNDGNLQRVSTLLLSNGNSKYVDGGWRYPMEISLKELVPTAYPCEIVPWVDEVDLTDERSRGINNAQEFERWVQAYNLYLREPTEEHSNALLQFGDLYIKSDETRYWHFYVLKDLDLSGFSDTPIVPVLRDIFDGQSTIYANGGHGNNTISGLSTTLFGTIEGENAKVQNFNIKKPKVNYGDSNTDPVGILANTISEGGAVEHCNIQDGTLYSPNAAAGMIAGKVEQGSVKNCTVSGFLVSSSTHDGVIGEKGSGYAEENNDASNVTTTSVEQEP